MRLYHFSDNPQIGTFKPRSVEVPVARPMGYEWLNGPLVWAIDETHSFLYFFPRDCPRVLLWATAPTTADDRLLWMGQTNARIVAFIEAQWLESLAAAKVYRYELPATNFESLSEIGMWVSRNEVAPIETICLADLRTCLERAGVELRQVESLTWLKPAWESTLHVSGIRLRNAIGWGEPGWPHSRPKFL